MDETQRMPLFDVMCAMRSVQERKMSNHQAKWKHEIHLKRNKVPK